MTEILFYVAFAIVVYSFNKEIHRDIFRGDKEPWGDDWPHIKVPYSNLGDSYEKS